MRIAIVEDHPAERELIATMCAEYFNGRNVGATAGRNAMQTVCDVFPDAKSFIESWKNSRYDLLLLDCYLSDENLPHATTGLDIARLLRNQNDDCAIVFITSSTDFAVLGYEVQASGYLLKPVNRKTFEATMERVEEQLKAKPPVTHLAKAQSPGTVDSSWHVAFGNPAVTMDRRLIAYALSNAHYVNSRSRTAPGPKSAPISPMWTNGSPCSTTSTAPREACSSTSTTCPASPTRSSS